MGITSGGNVGIGTSIPQNVLHARSSISGQGTLLRLQNSDNTVADTADIDFMTSSSTNGTTAARIGSIRTDRAVAGDTDFKISTISNGSLTEKMRVMDNGNVGIGTSLPNTFKLEMSGNIGPDLDLTRDVGTSTKRFNNIFGRTFDAGGNSMVLNTSGSIVFASGSSQKASIDSTGNVGIGTFAASTPLHVLGASTNDISINVETLSAGPLDASLGYLRFLSGVHSSATAGNRYVYLGGGDNSAIRPLALSTNGAGSYGNVGIGTFAPNALLDISSTAAQDLFRVNDNGTGDASPFLIDSTGNVGIGTTILGGGLAVMNGNVGIGTWLPTAGLQVKGATNTNIFEIVNSANNTAFSIDNTTLNSKFWAGSVTNPGISAGTQTTTGLFWPTDGGSNQLGFTGNALERMRINSNGNVGIGSIAPGAILDIAGKTRITTSGHLISTGTAPTVANNDCGTTGQGTVVAKSTDISGTVTVGTLAVTSCAVTFANSYTVAPNCVAVDDSNILAIKASASTTKLTIASTTSMSSDLVSWICIGNE